MAKRGVQVQHEKTSPAGALAHRPTVIQRKNPVALASRIKGIERVGECLRRDLEAGQDASIGRNRG